MSFDSSPDDVPPPRRRPQLTRRDVLRGGVWLSVGVGAAPLLAACNKQTPAASNEGAAPYPLARPDHPVTLPIKKSNAAIGDGLKPENGGTFKILNYDQYMAPGIMKDFGAKYDVKVQVTPKSTYRPMYWFSLPAAPFGKVTVTMT